MYDGQSKKERLTRKKWGSTPYPAPPQMRMQTPFFVVETTESPTATNQNHSHQTTKANYYLKKGANSQLKVTETPQRLRQKGEGITTERPQSHRKTNNLNNKIFALQKGEESLKRGPFPPSRNVTITERHESQSTTTNQVNRGNEGINRCMRTLTCPSLFKCLKNLKIKREIDGLGCSVQLLYPSCLLHRWWLLGCAGIHGVRFTNGEDPCTAAELVVFLLMLLLFLDSLILSFSQLCSCLSLSVVIPFLPLGNVCLVSLASRAVAFVFSLTCFYLACACTESLFYDMTLCFFEKKKIVYHL